MKTLLFPSLALLLALAGSLTCCSSSSDSPGGAVGPAAGGSSGLDDLGAAGQNESQAGSSSTIGYPGGY
jgi:hypothetical protein